jgi:hypothetical protein
LLGALAMHVDLGAVWDRLMATSPISFFGLVAFHGVILELRVRRWAGLAGAGLGPSRDACFAGWLACQALPGRLGEAVRPALAIRAGTAWPRAVAALVVERSLDLLVLALLFVAGAASARGAPPAALGHAAVGLGVVGAVVVGIAFGLGARRAGPMQAALGEDAPRALRSAAVTSLAIWTLEAAAATWAIATAASRWEPSAGAVWLAASTFSLALPALPGGLGPAQWASIVALGAFGLPADAAVTASLLDTAAVLAFFVPLGLRAIGRAGGVRFVRDLRDLPEAGRRR